MTHSIADCTPNALKEASNATLIAAAATAAATLIIARDALSKCAVVVCAVLAGKRCGE